MIKEVLKNIYQIEVPLPHNPLKVLNSYLIRAGAGERSLLIDTGFRCDECREALLAGLQELEVDMAETDIFLTHMHSDHAGLAPELVTEGTRVFISASDRKWVDGDTRDEMGDYASEQFLYAGFEKDDIDNSFKTHPGIHYAPDPNFHDYTEVKDGDHLQVGGYDLELIEVAGHTAGMMCIWIEQEKTMFTADHVLFDITPNITFWPDLPDSVGHYINNLKKTAAYPVERALPSHRESGDFHQRIRELLIHHENRLNETEQIIKDGPGQTAIEIAGKMTWDITARNWEEFPISQKWFAVGECMAHLERLMVEGKVSRQADESGGLYRYYPSV